MYLYDNKIKIIHSQETYKLVDKLNTVNFPQNKSIYYIYNKPYNLKHNKIQILKILNINQLTVNGIITDNEIYNDLEPHKYLKKKKKKILEKHDLLPPKQYNEPNTTTLFVKIWQDDADEFVIRNNLTISLSYPYKIHLPLKCLKIC